MKPAPGTGEDELLALAAAAESASEHALARALVEAAKARGLELATPVSGRAVPGRGFAAEVGGRSVCVGRAQWLRAEGVTGVEEPADSARSSVHVAADGRWLGRIELEDPLRPEAREVLSRIRALGLEAVLLSGDRPEVVRRVADELGIEDARGGLMPEEKLACLERLARERGPVGMVGDGLNDAPALARASVGIAVGGAAALSAETADLVLVRPGLEALPYALELCRRTVACLHRNLWLAFGYNALAIPIAGGALAPFGGPLLTPPLAAFLMSLSSVSVVGSSLLLARGLRQAAA